MEQRPLRLGDILDDYCPRERRVTNHAVVAMIEEDVKQTRCTTCDAEHVYRGGKAPRRKKPETAGALYKEVLAGLTDQDAVAAAVTSDSVAPVTGDDEEDLDMADTPAPAPPAIAAADAVIDQDSPEADEPQPAADEGPVHRPLIRAQLARPEGIKVERQAPEFTIRQNNGRGGSGSFRGGAGGGDGRARSGSGGGRPGGGGGGSNNNGHRFGRGPMRSGGRSGGPNPGFSRGPGGGSGGGQRPGRPPKRSR